MALPPLLLIAQGEAAMSISRKSSADPTQEPVAMEAAAAQLAGHMERQREAARSITPAVDMLDSIVQMAKGMRGRLGNDAFDTKLSEATALISSLAEKLKNAEDDEELDEIDQDLADVNALLGSMAENFKELGAAEPDVRPADVSEGKSRRAHGRNQPDNQDDLRQTLAEAAIRLAANRSFSSIAIREIVKEAGLDDPNLFHISFDGRAECLSAVLARMSEAWPINQPTGREGTVENIIYGLVRSIERTAEKGSLGLSAIQATARLCLDGDPFVVRCASAYLYARIEPVCRSIWQLMPGMTEGELTYRCLSAFVFILAQMGDLLWPVSKAMEIHRSTIDGEKRREFIIAMATAMITARPPLAGAVSTYSSA